MDLQRIPLQGNTCFMYFAICITDFFYWYFPQNKENRQASQTLSDCAKQKRPLGACNKYVQKTGYTVAQFCILGGVSDQLRKSQIASF